MSKSFTNRFFLTLGITTLISSLSFAELTTKAFDIDGVLIPGTPPGVHQIVNPTYTISKNTYVFNGDMDTCEDICKSLKYGKCLGYGDEYTEEALFISFYKGVMNKNESPYSGRYITTLTCKEN